VDDEFEHFHMWTEVQTSNGPKPPSRYGHSLTTISQKHAILIGGVGSSFLSDVWIFNSETKTWHQDDDLPSDPSEGQRGGLRDHTAVVAKKRLFVVGGQRSDYELSSSVLAFDLESP
jgi:hypothetical protein